MKTEDTIKTLIYVIKYLADELEYYAPPQRFMRNGVLVCDYPTEEEWIKIAISQQGINHQQKIETLKILLSKNEEPCQKK